MLAWTDSLFHEGPHPPVPVVKTTDRVASYIQ